MYIYKYNDIEYSSWHTLLKENKATLGNISFPVEEKLTETILAEHSIMRYGYQPPAPPEPTLAELKEQKINELKRERNKEEKKPVTTDLGLFDFDDNSRSRINGAMTVLQGTENTVEWTLADNTSADVGYDDLKSVIVAGGIRCNMLHMKYRDLRDLVNDCTTKEEVEAISWGIINNVQ